MTLEALARYPRVHLAHLPTPLEPLPNISRDIGVPSLYVKRDDCTGLAMGGNKARQLEFYFGDALSRDATVVLITGAIQSNYVRSVAAAAAKMGLGCVIQLEDRVKEMGPAYHRSGNVLLDELLGAEIRTYPEGEDEAGADLALEGAAEEFRSQGARPYVIHLSPDHPPLGALGYVEAAAEIVSQSAATGIDVGSLVVASGSGQTHAGLLVGLRALGRSDVRVHGICVRRPALAQRERVYHCTRSVSELLGLAEDVQLEDVLVSDDQLGPGYGRPTPASENATLTAARLEGLLVDPVYTAKALAGMLSLARAGSFEGRAAVFVHTGGTPALFGYGNA